ncbi:MAG TPA: glycosyltransferase [Nitrososphaeraceae archaeon]|jgi:glycosyltransferase involved in cell wall biosynthesis
MVSTEYPPMQGGVGRYTYNLTNALRKKGFDVQVVCNKLGNGDFFGLSPSNADDSNVILQLVDKIKPDIVHIQYEQGMYGLVLAGLDPRKTHTNIDSFYDHCKVPIVTTFHSAYTIRQWLKLVVPLKLTSKLSILKKYSNSKIIRYWKRIINYNSFHNLNKEKAAKSAASIVFSEYMSKMIGGGQVILHGAESNSTLRKGKMEARNIFNLPQENRIALALGFATVTKGWDILEKINLPSGWKIVVNSSTNHLGIERCGKNLVRNGIINLQKDFLSEEELSLLFSSADAVILPYKVSSGSGVMFDALAHGLPFVATDLDFFNEYATKGLGITVKRNPVAFSKALADLGKDYIIYKRAVDEFMPELSWRNIASQHGQLYRQTVKAKAAAVIPASSVR